MSKIHGKGWGLGDLVSWPLCPSASVPLSLPPSSPSPCPQKRVRCSFAPPGAPQRQGKKVSHLLLALPLLPLNKASCHSHPPATSCSPPCPACPELCHPVAPRPSGSLPSPHRVLSCLPLCLTRRPQHPVASDALFH